MKFNVRPGMTFAAAAASSRLSAGTMMRLERPLSQGSIPRSSGPLQGHSTSPPARPKSASSGKRPTSTPPKYIRDESTVSGRVRVAVRLRPQNDEELIADADFADCVELESELKRLKLRKNNWSSETFQFDEVFTETASQKRVYEVVAKPVVESVLNGYNGTVMAYGQTGTGKTFTLGQLGEEDSADRGIMMRALEDILADLSPDHDTVSVSYLQLYLETVQDLLAPEKDNIPIVEDPKTGEVSLPGATIVQVHDHNNFVRLLQTGEVNRFAANTKLNTESSRSHAILLVYVKRSMKEKNENEFPLPNENGSSIQQSKGNRMPTMRKSKLLIVDLAGSERIDKSGSEGHTLEEAKSINLSLTALGKCINALAENSPHIPTRDSKLTRLLRDSFGGTARTSLVITIGPSPRHRGETASTIMFGQRAMKVENMVKLKEEFDYKSLCRKLENQVDILTAENERQSKLVLDTEQKMDKKLQAVQWSLIEAETKLATNLEAMAAEKLRFQNDFRDIVCKLEQEHGHRERMEKALENLQLIYEEKEKELQTEKQRHRDELSKITQLQQQEILEIRRKLEAESAEKEAFDKELKVVNQILHDQNEKIDQLQMEKEMHQRGLVDMTQTHQQEISEIVQKLDAERAQSQHMEEQLKVLEKTISQQNQKIESQDQNEILELRKRLEEQCELQGNMEKELRTLQIEKGESSIVKAQLDEEVQNARQKLKEEQKQRGKLEDEVKTLKQQLLQLSYEVNETRKNLDKENSARIPIGSESPMSLLRSAPMRDTISGQRATIAKIFEEVGLQKILSLLESEDVDVRIHAVKVVANLAAEEVNQEKIVEAGGLASLLTLLETSEDETIQRVSAGAIANLAMNETNQELIMNQGGIRLLAKIANKAEDPQTLRMVAGAVANLCGNDKLQMRLREEGGIKALLGMVRSRHLDVLAQVARGVANFAKCESRGATQGHKKGRSLLVDDGALPWIVANSNSEAAPIKRHIELALCHLAQHEANARDLVACGALWELVRISRECSREDIRNLAKRTLNSNSLFQTELRRMHLPRE